MDLPTTQALLPFLAVLLMGGVVGFFLGSARSRRKRHTLQRQLNTQTVNALEGKTKLKKLHHIVVGSQRKDRLIKLLMQQVRDGKAERGKFSESMSSQEKRHYIEKARLNMAAVEARQQAQQATAAAQKATRHLRLLERTVRATQTIDAPPPKSYGQGQPVPVSVVDQQTPDARRHAVSKMSNRDTQRLAHLQSSNEEHLNGHSADPSPINNPPPAAVTAASLAQTVKKSHNGVRSTRT